MSHILNALIKLKGAIKMPKPFNCAVCGNLVAPDDFGLCNACEWEGDPVQEEDPNYRGGANPDSLNERRAWWLQQTSRRVPIDKSA